MTIPSIGQIVRIQPIIVNDERSERLYKSRVADLNENYLFFEIPIEENSSRVLLLPKDTECFFQYFDMNGTQFKFRSRVVGRKDENIPLMIVEIPSLQDIEKSQKRGYLRVDTSLDVAIRLTAPDRDYHLVTKTIDIGGGGLSFRTTPLYQFHLGDQVRSWFVFPLKDSGLLRLSLEGEVVRVKEPEENKERFTSISIKFTSIKDREHQLIMRYCFERQLELYKKGIV